MSDEKRNNQGAGQNEVPEPNRDPISGETGAHPLGVGLGSAGGAAVGAAVGFLAGPAGSVVGAAIGGLAGGLTGKGLAEGVNPTVEDAYWREHYASRPYVKAGSGYEAYQPAYRFGWEGRGRHGNIKWEEAESHLREEWRRSGHEKILDWDMASQAARDAFDRLGRDADFKENI